MEYVLGYKMMYCS